MALDTFAMEVNLKIGSSYLADVHMTSEKLLAVLKAPSPYVKNNATSNPLLISYKFAQSAQALSNHR